MFLSPTKMLSVVHICHFAKDTNCKDLFTFQIGQIDEWEDSKARLGRGLGTLFHQRETVPSQGTTLNHTALCLIILVALTSVLSLSSDGQQTLMQHVFKEEG